MIECIVITLILNNYAFFCIEPLSIPIKILQAQNKKNYVQGV